jgi:hypothetical protein
VDLHEQEQVEVYRWPVWVMTELTRNGIERTFDRDYYHEDEYDK